MMTDPRTLDILDLSGIIREHVPAWVVPYVNEYERQYFVQFAGWALERAEFARKAAEANECRRAQ